MTTGEDLLPLLLDRAAQGVASFTTLLFLLLCQSKEEEIAILLRIHCPCLFSMKAEPCPCGFPLSHRANLTLSAVLGGLPSFSNPLLYMLARLRLCVCRFN
ncbi:hypothetical protein YC2023_100750 [Brassica napus]